MTKWGWTTPARRARQPATFLASPGAELAYGTLAGGLCMLAARIGWRGATA